MGNLWKALIHGSAKTKTIIISMFILVVGGAVALIMGISSMSLVLLGGGAIAMVVGLLMMFTTTFTPTEKNPKENHAPMSLTEAKRRELLSISSAGYDVKGKNDAILKNEKTNTKVNKDSNTVNENKPASSKNTVVNEYGDSYDASSDEQLKKNGYIADESSVEEEDIDTTGLSDAEAEYARKVSSRKKSNRDKYGMIDIDGGDSDEDDNQNKPLVYQAPDKKSAALRKKLLKVKPGDKKYTPIFIDSCKSLVAFRTPAYVQIKGKDAIIMLMERNIRTHTIPLKKFLEVSYARNVEEKSPESYDILKEDKELYKVFEDLMPTLYPTNNVLSSTMLKNQYILGNDLAITPRSMKNLISKMNFNLHLFDALNLKGDYSKYFQMAYENRILWTDNCITQTEYQNRIRNTLQMMVDDNEILEYDLEDDTEMMIRYKLITREYADYYLARKRERINKG